MDKLGVSSGLTGINQFGAGRVVLGRRKGAKSAWFLRLLSEICGVDFAVDLAELAVTQGGEFMVVVVVLDVKNYTSFYTVKMASGVVVGQVC